VSKRSAAAVDRTQVHVRLVDIDAPELGQAFWRRSRDSLAGLCAGKVAQVEDHGCDRYRRTLGAITCDGMYTNDEQSPARDGVGLRYAPKNSPHYWFETAACAERRGLWIDRRPMAPWQWRRSHRY
jgi:endonuclease YncB( thermonuclease family)